MAEIAPHINAAEVAIKYAKEVISGSIVAGKLVKLAAKRFIRDLKNGAARGLRFDTAAAQHVVDFFGHLHHSKGEWGGRIFILSPFQVFVLANLFGWKRADGTRRFRESYIELARKNGKSTFVSGIALYMEIADGEPGAEVYSAATKKDQAKIVFDEAVRMMKASPSLAGRLSLNQAKGAPQAWRNLNDLATNSKFEPLPADAGTLDGLNIHCAIIDELHEHTSRYLYDKIIKATGSRRQPMVIEITTAGCDRQSICFKQREYGEKTLTGLIPAAESDYFFTFIACLDEGDPSAVPPIPPDDIFDEKNWPKGNPNLGVSKKMDNLRQGATKALNDNTERNSFMRYDMNVWTTQDVRWMQPEKWAACNAAAANGAKDWDPKKLRLAAEADLAGRVCFGGLDLSSVNDITAYLLLFPPVSEIINKRREYDPKLGRMVENEYIERPADTQWRVLPYFWLPQGSIAERVRKDRIQYDVWVREGFIETTPGNTIDKEFIRAKIHKLAAIYKLEKLGYDRWSMNDWLAPKLLSDGLPVEGVGQGFESMTSPMREIMGLVLSIKLEHYGNPVLAWMASNVAVKTDPAGSIKPDKDASREKIDGISALADCVYVSNKTPDAGGESVYNRRGIVFL